MIRRRLHLLPVAGYPILGDAFWPLQCSSYVRKINGTGAARTHMDDLLSIL